MMRLLTCGSVMAMLLPLPSMALPSNVLSENTLPAITLPATSLPSSNAAAALPPAATAAAIAPTVLPDAVVTAQPVVAAATVTPSQPIADDRFSFGDVSSSLLFTKEQIEYMKSALRGYESKKVNSADGPTAAVEIAAPQAIEEPAVYPTFYLTSIVYHHADDWTVWVATDSSPTAAVINPSVSAAAPSASGVNLIASPGLIRITPKNNTGELKAARVTADHVDFIWKPTYMAAMKQRGEDNKFAAFNALKHRLIMAKGARYDAASESVRFTLSPNQSFASAYFNCFEGKIGSLALTPLNSPDAMSGIAAGISGIATPGIGGKISSSRADIDSLLAAEQAKKQP